MLLLKRKSIIIWLALAVICLAVFLTVWSAKQEIKKMPPAEFGVTFTKARAEYLGLNWRDVYLSILEELKARSLRISAYWPEIETEKDVYNFSDLDWLVDEAVSRQATIILAVGRRLPSWPECHIPEWAKNLSEEQQQEKILDLIKETINRYKPQPLIWAWQLENEPFLSTFGVCPPPDRKFFEKELAMIKFLDKRPIIVTESGELSTWINGGRYGDILGVTIYRVVWDKHFKYFYHPWPAVSYYLKGKLVQFFTGVPKIIVVELQGEPWYPSGSPLTTSLDEQFKTMNLERLKNTVNYARQTGFEQSYLWGAEWWYWLKAQGYPEIWDYAQELFKSQL